MAPRAVSPAMLATMEAAAMFLRTDDMLSFAGTSRAAGPCFRRLWCSSCGPGASSHSVPHNPEFLIYCDAGSAKATHISCLSSLISGNSLPCSLASSIPCLSFGLLALLSKRRQPTCADGSCPCLPCLLIFGTICQLA